MTQHVFSSISFILMGIKSWIIYISGTKSKSILRATIQIRFTEYGQVRAIQLHLSLSSSNSLFLCLSLSLDLIFSLGLSLPLTLFLSLFLSLSLFLLFFLWSSHTISLLFTFYLRNITAESSQAVMQEYQHKITAQLVRTFNWYHFLFLNTIRITSHDNFSFIIWIVLFSYFWSF